MALTKTEKLLLDGLKLFGLRRGNAFLTMFLLDTDEKRWDMILFLKEIIESEKEITEEQIVDLAYQMHNHN